MDFPRKPWLYLLMVAALPCVLGPFWGAGALQLCPESEASYDRCREKKGFEGLPIEGLREGLDRLLPVGATVTLAPELSANTLAWQRLTEGLYPRRVTNDAPNTLGMLAVAQGPLPEWPGRGRFVLTGSQVRTVAGAPDAKPRPPSLWWIPLDALGLLGLGLLGAWLVNRVANDWLPHPGASGLLLLGGVGVALLYSLATWFRFAVPVSTLRLVGWAAIGVTLPGHVLRLRQKEWRLAFAERLRDPAWWCMLVPALLLGLYWSRTPISGWDGRSIWFFRAHELAWHGVFHPVDVFNEAYLFSNPSYPLFFPAWLAFFGAHGPFSERHAAMGMAVLLWALATPIAVQLRARHGNLLATMVTLALLGSAAVSLAGGYPDMVLAAALMLAGSCLYTPGTQGLAAMALLLAGLCKREGAVLVAILWMLHLLAAPDRTQRWLRLRFLVCFLPGVAHAVWYVTTGLPEIYAGSVLPAPAEVFPMLGVLVSRFFGGILVPPDKLLAVVALGVVLLRARAHRFSMRHPMVLLGTAALMAFALAALSVMMSPFRFEWHVETAFDRVILSGCWLSVAAAMTSSFDHPCKLPAGAVPRTP